MRITLVAALDRRRVIGAGSRIPWRLPDDQRAFKRLTTGHCLVMGRRTYESIGRALPDRTTIVLTRNPAWSRDDAIAVRDLDQALETARARGETECFVVGGADVYAAALPRADRLVLTRVDADVEGDVYFPDVDLGGDTSPWKLVREERHAADARHAHTFVIQEWERVSPAPREPTPSSPSRRSPTR